MRHDQAIAIILEGRGTHFDPDVVGALAEITDEFKEIAGRYSDDSGGQPVRNYEIAPLNHSVGHRRRTPMARQALVRSHQR
jgi:HD-GYP domain-containing protein (c-di-GMP phosphodiesterase class II)